MVRTTFVVNDFSIQIYSRFHIAKTKIGTKDTKMLFLDNPFLKCYYYNDFFIYGYI